MSREYEVRYYRRTSPFQAGFTLAELLVVVALVGILGTIASAEYSSLMAKSRTVEAKMALGNAYNLQRVFFGEKGSYTACLRQIGYTGEQNARRYYSIGFAASGGTTCGNGTQDCLMFDFGPGGPLCTFGIDTFVPATITAGTYIVGGAPDFLDAIPSATKFIVGACGRVAHKDVADEWQINEAKIIRHRTSGLY